MPHPKPGDAGYAQYREEYNARRRKRRKDPEYRRRQNARMKVQAQRRRGELESDNAS